LAVYFNPQEIYISLEVGVHSQGNYIFYGGSILALKEILNPQGNSRFCNLKVIQDSGSVKGGFPLASLR
jgi:hypothetical protein